MWFSQVKLTLACCASFLMAQHREQVCRLCTREVGSDAIDLFSTDSVERGMADRMATILDLPLEKEDGLTAYVCQLCNARFGHLVRSLDVHRLQAKKSHEKLAKKAGIFVDKSKFNTSTNSLFYTLVNMRIRMGAETVREA